MFLLCKFDLHKVSKSNTLIFLVKGQSYYMTFEYKSVLSTEISGFRRDHIRFKCRF